MLGITQASVSTYLSAGPDRPYNALESLSIGREEADRYASLLAEDIKRSPVYGVETLETLWTRLLGRGSICDAHRRLYPGLANCDVCIKQYGKPPGEGPEALRDVAEAVRMVEASPTFVRVMPQVSVNIAEAPEATTSPEEVAAIPGRVVRVGNRAKAFEAPAFGASRHLAGILLIVNKRRKDLRSVINLRYDRRMERVLRKLRLRLVEIGDYPIRPGADPTLDALAEKMRTSNLDFDAVVDRGRVGVEPNVYLFGAKATDAARLAVRVSRTYSAS